MEVREDVEDRWIRLDNLLEIRLSNCKECEEIPTLGHLPRLKSLYLCHLSNVKSMGSSFYGIKEDEVNKETLIVFPALEKLELIDMVNMTAWAEVELPGTQPREVLVFHRLEYLKISKCRQLKSAPSHFPCLKELEINRMESGLALASICGSKLTTLRKLNISDVDGMVCLPDGLFNNNLDLLELRIRDCGNLKELPEDVHKLNALKELRIWRCKSIEYPSGRQLSSQGFTSLRHLEFIYCSGLTNLPCEMLESCALSLETLVLTGSESLTNLPQVMSFLHKMSHLTKLGIRGVPKLVDVVVEIGSLRSIEELSIGGSSDCGDYVSFKASLDRIFPALPSLRVLRLYVTLKIVINFQS